MVPMSRDKDLRAADAVREVNTDPSADQLEVRLHCLSEPQNPFLSSTGVHESKTVGAGTWQMSLGLR